MDEFVLFKDCSKNKKYRKSFSNLAADTFGLNFEMWFEKGIAMKTIFHIHIFTMKK